MTLFESAAILLYLADKAGRLLPATTEGRWQAIQWLQFHASSMGPVLGQRVHFEIFAEARQPAAIERYRRLSEEAFSTLDRHLATRTWLADDEYSIADIATFGWTHTAAICGFDFTHHRHLVAWHARVAKRPAAQRGITRPEPATGPAARPGRVPLGAERGHRLAGKLSEWIAPLWSSFFARPKA